MFRKIVTESTYSPALAASLGEYIRRLRRDTIKRQVGFVFVLLSIVIQLFATLLPPESANAKNPEIFIDGGVRSVQEYLGYYDENAEGIKDLLNSLGITRLNIETAIPTTLSSADDASLWLIHNTRDENDTAHHFSSLDGSPRVAYHRPLSQADMPLQAFVSSSSSLGWFAIARDTGNLISRTPTTADCSPWSPALSSGSSDTNIGCGGVLESSLSMHSVSSSSRTTPEEAKPSDRIMYTLSMKNTGDTVASTPLRIDLTDILEYSQLIDRGGGLFDPKTKLLSWPEASLAAEESLVRSFTVRLLPTTPAVAQGAYITSSYDCVMSASFGDTLALPVACPLIKHIERTTSSLPKASTGANLTFIACLLALSLYLLLRSKQLLAELYIIRHNHLGAL